MKAILVDPFKRSLETIDIESGDGPYTLLELHRLVGEDGCDFAYPYPGVTIAVGDHSALQEPPLPAFTLEGYKGTLYGRGVVFGRSSDGKSLDSTLSVGEFSELIEWL